MFNALLKPLAAVYFNNILQHPLRVLLSVFVLAIVLASQLGDLKIDASSDSLTLEYDKDLDYFREISKRYQSGDFLVVTYRPHSELLAQSTLDHLKSLHDELATVEGVASANSILDVPLLYSPRVSLLEVARGTKTLLDEGVDRSLVADEFTNSPVYKNMLLGPDGKTTAILLNIDVDQEFIQLVRDRDALRLKRDKEGQLSADEQQQLAAISQEFLDYSTAVAEKNHRRVEEVRAIVDNYRLSADIFLGGVSMITADMVDFIRSDITVFGLGIIAFIIIILTIIFRQWQFVLLPLVTCFLAVTVMLGFLASVDWRLTVISSNFVALLLIVSLAITIHLIVRYREALGQQPNASNRELVEQTIRIMAKPCLYTVLTTVVAFVSLVVSGIRPIIDFGWMMTIGLCISFSMAFLVIPAGLMLLPKAFVPHQEDKSAAFTMIFSRFTERRGGIIVVVGVVAAIISAVGISRLEVENRFIDYFRSSTEIHQGMLVIDQQLGGTITLDVILNHYPVESQPIPDTGPLPEDPFAPEGGGSDDPFSSDPFASNVPAGDSFGGAEEDPFTADADPFAESVVGAVVAAVSPDPYNSYWFTQAGLERIQQLHNYLDSLSEVGKVQSLATLFQVATDLNGRAPNDFELAVMRRALPGDITDLLVKPYLSPDIGQTRITMRVKETDPNLRRAELLEKIQTYLVNDMAFTEDEVQLTGLLVLYNNMLQSLFKSQILTIGAVFIGILAMFLVLFRSLSLSLIALIPNMLAALVVLGGMGLVGIPLDMMTITIAAIAVGIGVDNAIHYIYRFRREFSIEANYITAMHRSHASIGRAMYYTSVTVIVGFSILALSEFIPSIYFGLLTGLAMFAAIIASLTLLPKLILLVKPLGPPVLNEASVERD